MHSSREPDGSGLTLEPFVFTHLDEKAKKKLEEDAINAIQKVQTRLFKLVGFKNPAKPRILCIGCQGNGKDAQAAVAKLISELPEDEKPDVIIVAGDNLYDYGASSPLDPQFRTHFHIPYKIINGIPVILVPGNHDANRHSKAVVSNKWTSNPYKGKDAIERQCAHTFIPSGERYTSVDQLINLFNRKEIRLSDLQAFNMPKDYAEYDLGPIQLFCIDSNFIVNDYLEYTTCLTALTWLKDYESKNTPCDKFMLERDFVAYLNSFNQDNLPKFWLERLKKIKESPLAITGISTDFTGYMNNITEHNQCMWLKERTRLAKNAGKEVFILGHHPPISHGKRAIPSGWDAKHYLWPHQIETTCKLLDVKTKSYNDFIYTILKKLDVIEAPSPQQHRVVIIPAHDHSISVDDNDEFWQFVMGGGGGDLQNCHTLKHHPNMKVHMRRNGFSIYQDGILDIYTTSKELVHIPNQKGYQHQRRLRYDTKNHTFITEKNHADSRVLILRDQVLKLVELFILELKEKELTHTTTPIKAEPEVKPQPQSYMGRFFSALNTTYQTAAATVNYMKNDWDPNEEEIFCINDLKAYFLQYRLPDLFNCLEYLKELHLRFEEIEKKRTEPPVINPFSQKLKADFFAEFKESLESLHQKEAKPKVSNTPEYASLRM